MWGLAVAIKEPEVKLKACPKSEKLSRPLWRALIEIATVVEVTRLLLLESQFLAPDTLE